MYNIGFELMPSDTGDPDQMCISMKSAADDVVSDSLRIINNPSMNGFD